jgi:hypothetical protein
MFEIGKRYIITMDEGKGTTDLWNCVAEAEEGPVVKFQQHGKELIVNTASTRFVSAKPQE